MTLIYIEIHMILLEFIFLLIYMIAYYILYFQDKKQCNRKGVLTWKEETEQGRQPLILQTVEIK